MCGVQLTLTPKSKDGSDERCSKGSQDGAREVRFGVHVRNDNRERTPPRVRLKALCGPGDQGEPVISVMQPDED
jgi:hypothetical protein